MGYTYIKNRFIVYLKFELGIIEVLYFYLPNLAANTEAGDHSQPFPTPSSISGSYVVRVRGPLGDLRKAVEPS